MIRFPFIHLYSLIRPSGSGIYNLSETQFAIKGTNINLGWLKPFDIKKKKNYKNEILLKTRKNRKFQYIFSVYRPWFRFLLRLTIKGWAINQSGESQFIFFVKNCIFDVMGNLCRIKLRQLCIKWINIELTIFKASISRSYSGLKELFLFVIV